MKCRNKAQNTQQICNDVDYDTCVGCPSLCSWDWVGCGYVRCNNSIPIKFGETIKPLEKAYPCHRRKDKCGSEAYKEFIRKRREGLV